MNASTMNTFVKVIALSTDVNKLYAIESILIGYDTPLINKFGLGDLSTENLSLLDEIYLIDEVEMQMIAINKANRSIEDVVTGQRSIDGISIDMVKSQDAGILDILEYRNESCDMDSLNLVKRRIEMLA